MTVNICSIVSNWIHMFRLVPSSLSTISHCTVGRAAIQMVTNATSVAETAESVEVCAEITGVTGLLECAVTNTPTLTGSTKTGIAMRLKVIPFFSIHFE